jgi:dipeptidyl aminopeptidase/acylaminoacyl peptidase
MPEGAATVSIDRFDFATGAQTKLFQDPRYDVAQSLNDDWTRRVIGYAVDEDMPVYRYFAPKRQALQNGLEQAFPGLSVHAVSTDRAGNRAIVEVTGPKTPPSYYLYDRVSHHASAIAASYPGLSEGAMGEVRPYGYAARDGLHIPAYLTLPPNKSPHNLPLVVVPHGGPDARDDMTFDFIRQFLASRGYAVLQPQFRGSRGFGQAFTQAGFGEWGLKVQDDITDGVKKTIADGIVDPKRICIFGASYGGYAALAGATLTPELYACAASLAGPSSLEKMLDYSSNKFGATAENYWLARIGDNAAQRDAASPALYADRVTAPILLLHSELDVTVPIEQSEIMERALRKAGKKVAFVSMPGDDHYMALEQTRLRVLQELEKFFAANIGS